MATSRGLQISGKARCFPDRLEDWIGEDNPVRVIDVFVDELDLAELRFSGVYPEATAARAQCFRQGVFTRPRPTADKSPRAQHLLDC